MEKYTVKIVTPKEWRRLVESNPRYQHAEDSVGFADPQTRTGYVMNTGVHRLNRYLLNHEFEHLVEEHATDEDEFGVRHKKFFKQILAPIVAPYISPFIQKGFSGEAFKDVGRNLLATGGGFLTGGPVGAIAGTVGQSLRNAANPEGTPLTGRSALGAAGTGAGVGGIGAFAGNALGLPSGATASPLSGLFGGGAKAGQAAPQATQLTRGAAGATGAAQPTQVAFGSSLTSPASRLAGGIGGASQAANPLSKFGLPQTLQFSQPAALSQAPAGLGQAFSQAAQSFQGAGPSLSQFGSTVLPGIPSIPPPQPPAGNLIKQFLDKAKAGLGNFAGQAAGGALGSAAMNAFSGAGQGGYSFPDLAIAGGLVGAGQAAPTPQVPSLSGLPSVQRLQQSANQGYASDIGRVANTRLDEQLNRPYTGVSEGVQSAIRRPYQEERIQEARNLKAYQPGFNLDESSYQQAIAPSLRGEADALALAEQRNRETFESQRRQDIQMALGVDENTFQQLSDLANLDVQQIALQAGIDFEMARQFKETMGSLAGLFATRGLGLNRFQLSF